MCGSVCPTLVIIINQLLYYHYNYVVCSVFFIVFSLFVCCIVNPRARCTCAAKGYCSWSVFRFVGLSARFLPNRGCGGYQTWICGRYNGRADLRDLQMVVGV